MTVWWAVVFLAIFFIGITKSGFGSGGALLIVPVTLLAMDHTPYGSKVTLGLMLPLLTVGDLIAVWQYRRLFSLGIVRRLLPGTLVGVVVGGLLLRWFDSHSHQVTTGLIEVEVGLESVVLVGLHWWRTRRGDLARVARPSQLKSALVGSFAGFSSTLAHAAGPILALYLLPLKLDRQLFVGTCAIYFFLLNAAKLPIYLAGGQFTRPVLLLSAQAMPLVVAGAVAGFWLTRGMNDRVFSKIIYAVTFGLGWYLLYLGGNLLVWAYTHGSLR